MGTAFVRSRVKAKRSLLRGRRSGNDLLGRVFMLGIYTGGGTWTANAVTGPTRYHTVTLKWNGDSIAAPRDIRLKVPIGVLWKALDHGLVEEI